MYLIVQSSDVGKDGRWVAFTPHFSVAFIQQKNGLKHLLYDCFHLMLVTSFIGRGGTNVMKTPEWPAKMFHLIEELCWTPASKQSFISGQRGCWSLSVCHSDVFGVSFTPGAALTLIRTGISHLNRLREEKAKTFDPVAVKSMTSPTWCVYFPNGHVSGWKLQQPFIIIFLSTISSLLGTVISVVSCIIFYFHGYVFQAL